MKTLEELQAKAWEIAFSHHLSDYPQGKTPTEILRMVEEEHEDVLVWEPFEYWSPYTVIENIEMFYKWILPELEWVQQ